MLRYLVNFELSLDGDVDNYPKTVQRLLKSSLVEEHGAGLTLHPAIDELFSMSHWVRTSFEAVT